MQVSTNTQRGQKGLGRNSPDENSCKKSDTTVSVEF